MNVEDKAPRGPEADGRRLDWIEQYQPIIGWVHVAPEVRHRRVEFTIGPGSLIPRTHQATGPVLRDAIDAGMRITGDLPSDTP